MKAIKIIQSTLLTSLLAVTVVANAEHHATAEKAAESPLDAALSAQSEKAIARYQYRNPKETLEFFGIEPGMRVLEALPGGGWYSKILLPYLGESGHLVGVDYPLDMWGNFSFMTEEAIKKKETWAETWVEGAQPWRGETGASVSAATFATVPDDLDNSLDAAVFIRALHNLARFSDKGNYLENSLKATYKALKPGGVLGVVQHRALEDRPDAWADGSNGYLKQSFVIEQAEAAGFEFVAESSINANDKDQAVEGDFVWRLPPTLNGAKDNEELKEKMLAIGESNRMTLKFRKPE